MDWMNSFILTRTSRQRLLQPQLLLILQVLHLLTAALPLLPTAVVHAGAAGGGHPEGGHPAWLHRLQLHGAGQFVPAAVEGPARIREEQLEHFQFVSRGQNHGGNGGDQ